MFYFNVFFSCVLFVPSMPISGMCMLLTLSLIKNSNKRGKSIEYLELLYVKEPVFHMRVAGGGGVI